MLNLIKKKLSRVFKSTLIFKTGQPHLFIQRIYGRNKHLRIDIENLRINFHPLSYFFYENHPFFQVLVDKIDIEVFNANKRNKKRYNFSIENWGISKILTFCFIIICRSASLVVKKFSIKYFGIELNTNYILLKLIRKQYFVSLNLKIIDVVLQKEIVLAYIPNFIIDVSSSTILLPYFIMLKFYELILKFKLIKVSYQPEQFLINKITLYIYSNNNDDGNCKIIIHSFNISLSNLNLYTKSLEASIHSLKISSNNISTKKIIMTRNSCNFVNINSLKFEKNLFKLEKPEFVIHTTLILDFSIIRRKFIEKIGFKSDNEQKLLRKMQIHTNVLSIRLCLSDSHIFNFLFSYVSINDMTLHAQNYNCDLIFQNSIFNILKGLVLQLKFYKPVFDLKADYFELTLSYSFAENSFIQETFAILSYIDKIYHGISTEEREKMPPLKRLFSLNLKHFRIKMLNNPLTIKIENSNEAKLISKQELIRRQEKAIEILNAQKAKNFNQDQFDYSSKEIQFKLYKEIFGLIKSDNYLFSFEGKNLSFKLDGPSVPNKSEALKQIEEYLPQIANENVGKLSGGLLTISLSFINIQIPHLGEIIRIDDSNLSGSCYIGKFNGTKRSDFYHFEIKCDNNQEHILIPQISAKSVTFLDLKGLMDKYYLKMTPAILDFFQNNKIGTRLFRLLKFKYNKLAFFDNCRIRIHVRFDFHIKEFVSGYNDSLRAFNHSDLILMNFSDTHFSILNGKFNILSENVAIRLLTNDCYKDFVIFKKLSLSLIMPSKNPLNQDGKRPIFIPIDSFRINDPEYDPFKKYRTITYSAIIKATISQSPIYICLDYVNDLIKCISKDNILSRFIRPPRFALSVNPRPFYSETEIDILFPQINLSYQQNKLLMKINSNINDLTHLYYSNNRRTTNVFINSKSLLLNCSLNSMELFGINFKDFSFNKTVEGIEISSSESIVDISSNIFESINLLSFSFPKKHILSSMPDLFTVDDLLNHFCERIIYCNLPEMKIRFHTCDNQFIQIISINTIFEIYENENNAKLFSLSFETINCSGFSKLSIFEIQKLRLIQAKSTTTGIEFININSLKLNIRSTDFDMFSSIAKDIGMKFQTFRKEESKSRIKHSTTFFLQNFLIKLIQEDLLLCTINFDKIRLKNFLQEDKSQTTSFTIKSLNSILEIVNDKFRNLFETTKTPLFKMYIDKTSTIMKCPVIKILEVQVSTFNLRIPIPFIKQLIKIFPSAESFKVFDLDSMADDDDTPSIIENKIDDSEASNAMFCQEFIFHQFCSSLSIRRKEQGGAFSDFLDRPFQYQGLHFFDVFGTQDQLLTFVKKNLKWTVLKTFTKLVFSKKTKNNKDDEIQSFPN